MKTTWIGTIKASIDIITEAEKGELLLLLFLFVDDDSNDSEYDYDYDNNNDDDKQCWIYYDILLLLLRYYISL